MSIRAGVVVAVALHEIDNAPNAKPCSKGDNQSLQYVYCAVEKLHIYLTFCRFAAVKIVVYCGVLCIKKSTCCSAAGSPARLLRGAHIVVAAAPAVPHLAGARIKYHAFPLIVISPS